MEEGRTKVPVKDNSKHTSSTEQTSDAIEDLNVVSGAAASGTSMDIDQPQQDPSGVEVPNIANILEEWKRIEEDVSSPVTESVEKFISLVRKSYATAEALEISSARKISTLLASLSSQATENQSLRAKLEAKEAEVAPAMAAVADASAAEAVSLARARAAEADRDALSVRLSAVEVEKAALERDVARAADAAAKDAAALAVAETKVLDLTAYLSAAESRLKSAAGENEALLREGRHMQTESEAIQGRLTFLEKERVRLTAELSEAKAQHDIIIATTAKEREVDRVKIASLSDALDQSRERVVVADERATVLERQCADLLADRERARADAQREIDNLNSQLEIFRESTTDAEERMKDLKEVIAGMSAAMRASEARAIASGGLDPNTDSLLRHVQAELDRQLDELEAQRKEFEVARANEQKMAIAVEALKREKETALALAKDAKARYEVAQTKVEELLERNDRLEHRLLLAGENAARTYEYVESDNVFSNSGSIHERAQRAPLLLTPSKQALEGVLQELGDLRRRHDELANVLVSQQHLYRDFS